MSQGKRVVVAGVLLLAFAGSASAGENIIKFFERNKDVYITQGEWATYLVKAIGNEDKLPASSSQVDFIALLEKSRIAPLEGWQSTEFLTYGAKAVTMVQALGLSDQIPADATALDYIWYLEGLGFHEGNPTQLVQKTEALGRNINDPVFQELAGNEFNINVSEWSPKVTDLAPRR